MLFRSWLFLEEIYFQRNLHFFIQLVFVTNTSLLRTRRYVTLYLAYPMNKQFAVFDPIFLFLGFGSKTLAKHPYTFKVF